MATRNPNDLPQNGKLIAFDVGTRTIGVALSDVGRMIATPMQTLTGRKWKQNRSLLEPVIAQENIAGAVVGLPLHMDGSQGASADRALSFADQFEQDFGVPVLLWDERLSTVAAENALFEQRTGRQTRASKKDVKEQVDSVAAALILEGVLTRLREQG